MNSTSGRFYQQLRADKMGQMALLVLAFWMVVAAVSLITPLGQIATVLPDRLTGPGSQYFFGTDPHGQSVLKLLASGARTSILVSSYTVTLSLLVGIPLGATAGYFGGRIDTMISRVIDILLAFPPLILPIAVTAFFGGGLFNVVAALSLTGWVGYARLVRGQFLSLKEREYVTAARSLGASNIRLMVRHILPNTLSPLAVQATFSLASVIIAEAGLSFLGLGVNQSHVSWGGMLNEARSYLIDAPYLAFFPALALFSVVSSLNFLGEVIRLALDPRSSAQAGLN
jgi:ABC-type dipeptide/oligopeptide/nickel transport system permease subunit